MTTATAASDIASRLLDAAKRLGDRPALIQGEETITFARFAGEVETLAKGFARAGLTGQRVAVLIPPSPDMFAVAYALFRAGAVPVLIDPGIGFKNMGRCLAESEPAAFVGSPKAHAARVLGRWAPSAKLKICAAGRFPGTTPLSDIRALGEGGVKNPAAPSPSSAAAILFTSGSTGAPKGVAYLHSTFSAQVDLLREMFGIKEGEKSLATFPLFAVFDLALGLTVVLPRMDFTRPGFVDPKEIVDPLQKHRIEQLFGSPALLERVGRYGERHGIALPNLTRVMSAGAPVPAKTMSRFLKMLEPGTPIHTPYGATEALPVALTDSREILGETAAETARGKGTCVGRPVRGLEVAIVKITDEPIKSWDDSLRLTDGQVGEIVVKGPQVTGEYFRRVEDMAKAKIGDGKAFWHRMGDLGYFDGKGRLWFCGRKAHRVGELYTDPVEGVFNNVNGVRRTALVNVKGKPALCIETEDGATENDIRTSVLELAGSTECTRWVNDKNILFHPSFPVDIRHNAKIFREKLAVWAEDKTA